MVEVPLFSLFHFKLRSFHYYGAQWCSRISVQFCYQYLLFLLVVNCGFSYLTPCASSYCVARIMVAPQYRCFWVGICSILCNLVAPYSIVMRQITALFDSCVWPSHFVAVGAFASSLFSVRENKTCSAVKIDYSFLLTILRQNLKAMCAISRAIASCIIKNF